MISIPLEIFTSLPPRLKFQIQRLGLKFDSVRLSSVREIPLKYRERRPNFLIPTDFTYTIIIFEKNTKKFFDIFVFLEPTIIFHILKKIFYISDNKSYLTLS